MKKKIILFRNIFDDNNNYWSIIITSQWNENILNRVINNSCKFKTCSKKMIEYLGNSNDDNYFSII